MASDKKNNWVVVSICRLTFDDDRIMILLMEERIGERRG